MNVSQAWDNAVARTGNLVKAQYFFSANGQSIGSFGQLTSEDGSFKANFDVNFTPITDSYPSSVPNSVILQKGDTLRTVATRVFGDASLWYLIADENALTDPDAELEAGTQLRIPNDVVALSNSASSFKPFDVRDAIGDTTPTQPIPPMPKKGCGVLGMIIVIIVVIVVTILTWGAGTAPTAGAGGSALGAGAGGAGAAGAGVGAAAGTGAAAVGIGVIAASVGSAFVTAAATGAVTNAATQLRSSSAWHSVIRMASTGRPLLLPPWPAVSPPASVLREDLQER